MKKNQRVLVLGSTGMVGHLLCKYLISNSDFILFDIARSYKFRDKTNLFDVKNEKDFCEFIKLIKPDYIINCIGVLIRESNISIENAIYINSYFPHMLKKFASQINAKLIHISTDCVFSGKKGNYIESDFRDGNGIYAQTKILGEIQDTTNLTLRTSVIGPEIRDSGEGLFGWFMRQEDTISGFEKVIWSGVTTFELAKIVKLSIDNELTGLHHVTNNSSISKYELLKLFKKYTKKNIEIKPFNGKSLDKSFIDTRLLFGYKIPSYDDMIYEMISFIKNNKSMYPQYKFLNFDKK
jgi:dTDP-4-dehydrorhamnose reductase